jgi:hypothetical protein
MVRRTVPPLYAFAGKSFQGIFWNFAPQIFQRMVGAPELDLGPVICPL